MKAVIMGCGRVGARLAGLLDTDGHSVTILDTDTYSFRRLPPTFKGDALVGNGLDQEVLKRAGIEEADAFVATTQGDNRNIMAAQIAKHIFNVPKVPCARNYTAPWDWRPSAQPQYLLRYLEKNWKAEAKICTL